MKSMKKIFSLFIILSLVFCFVGCADNQNSSKSAGKVLVVYYSATGNTENVAKIIASNTNADVFEITPEKEYTADDLNWRNNQSRVCIEHDNPDKRNVELVKVTPDNFGDYDTVFIGYPIWWGIAACL